MTESNKEKKNFKEEVAHQQEENKEVLKEKSMQRFNEKTHFEEDIAHEGHKH